MGSTERKAREKEELKALILKAARKLFVEKGIGQTTIRNIADSIDYSIGTVYVISGTRTKYSMRCTHRAS